MCRRHRVAIVIAGTLLWSATLQAWSIRQAPVPALDAVRFVAQAQHIERVGLLPALRDDARRPLYPLAIYAVHTVSGAWRESPLDWIGAAQIVSAAAAVACVIPVFFVARILTSASAATIAAIVFATLPVVARSGAHATADSIHLLAFSLATWALLEAMRRGIARRRATGPTGPRRCGRLHVAGGACIGVALMARPDAVVILPAFALVMAVGAAANRSPNLAIHASWNSAVILFAVALVLSPLALLQYRAGTNSLSTVIGLGAPHREYATINHTFDRVAQSVASTPASAVVAPPFPPASLKSKDSNKSLRLGSWQSVPWEFLRELSSVLHGLPLAFAVAGIWSQRRRFTRRRAHQFAAVVTVVFFTLVLVAAARWRYLSPRHLLPVVPIAVAFAGAGVGAVARFLGNFLWSSVGGANAEDHGGVRALLPVAIASCLIVASLIKSVTPAHASHHAHRQAASWLKAHCGPQARILDSHGWTGLYSRRATYRYTAAATALSDAHLEYIVLDREETLGHSRRSRGLRNLLARRAELAATFLPPSKRRGDTVQVYRWNPAGAAAPASDRSGDSSRLSTRSTPMHRTRRFDHSTSLVQSSIRSAVNSLEQ